MNEERPNQREIHDAIEGVLGLSGPLTGWVIIYEYLDEDTAGAGHLYGPEGMTTWRALGLTEWASRHTLVPDGGEDE